jgi:hypothetical protein
MNVQINNLAQSARGESVCGFCGRRWFGLVAYCPYCGRKPSFPTINQEPDDRAQSDDALASGQRTLWMPAGELHGQEAKSPRKEPFLRIDQESDDRRQSDEALASGILGMPAGELQYQEAKSPRKEPRGTQLQGEPILGEALPRERKGPTPSQSSKKASTLLFKAAAAGLGVLLLLWTVVKLPAPKTDEGASPQLPKSTSGVASPSRGPSTTAAQQPPIPLRTDTAVPAGDQTVRQQERDPAQAAPQSKSRPLCSVAHQTAGLCKSK